jgi:hypothetical protein
VTIRLSRLAVGDYLASAGGLVLLIVLFAMRWYEARPGVSNTLLLMGARVSANGWQTFTWIGPLCLIVGLLAVAAAWLQLMRDSPALPIVSVLVLTPLALLLVLALIVRVLISVPSVQLPGSAASTLARCAGAYVGLASAVVILIGAWLSLRRDGVDPGDSPALIETLPLGPS